ncbi:MAG: glycosyltransferase, partial [Rhizobiaceae bacterium]
VIVSSGGGGFGGELMGTALQLANSDDRRRWCLATGPNLDPVVATAIRKTAASNVTIVERLDNLAEHMKSVKISISQCGYNTAMDVLAAHEASDCRAVFVPHDTTGQTEQLRRAKLLEAAGYAVCVPQSELTTECLRDAVRRAETLPKVSRDIDFDGATNSARLLREWIEAR